MVRAREEPLLLSSTASGIFFDVIMTMAYRRGIVVFVSTSNLMVAKFLYGLNDGTKACALFKPVSDVVNFKCQKFDWTEEKRLEFIRLRTKQKGWQKEDALLCEQAKEAFNEDLSVGEMDLEIEAARYIYTTTSEETQDEQSLLSSGCHIL
jgi:hypothetical protein